MVTIKDIAKKLEVGVSTVSMALNDNPKINEKTRELVKETAKNMGYIKNGLATDLQKGASSLILLVVDDASRAYFSRVINDIQRHVSKYNYDLLICTTYGKQDKTAKKYISEHRAAGAIVFTMNISDEFIQQYATNKFPIYVMGRYVEGKYINSEKYSDYEEQMKRNIATRFLINKGCRKIAFVKAGSTSMGSLTRYKGYLQELKNFNIRFNEDIIFSANDNSIEKGYQVTKGMILKIKSKLIDSIVYANDDIAIGGLKCLLDNGIRIPEDVSIIGHNSLPIGKLIEPKLTSVYFKDPEISNIFAVESLIARIEGRCINTINRMYRERFLNNKEIVVEGSTVKEGEV